jgi:hypothetical protein
MAVEFRRIGDKRYSVVGTTLEICADEWYCPLDEVRFPRVEWVVVDTATGWRAFDGEGHETLADAKYYAARNIQRRR